MGCTPTSQTSKKNFPPSHLSMESMAPRWSDTERTCGIPGSSSISPPKNTLACQFPLRCLHLTIHVTKLLPLTSNGNVQLFRQANFRSSSSSQMLCSVMLSPSLVCHIICHIISRIALCKYYNIVFVVVFSTNKIVSFLCITLN